MSKIGGISEPKEVWRNAALRIDNAMAGAMLLVVERCVHNDAFGHLPAKLARKSSAVAL
jgi:hypothetical protein